MKLFYSLDATSTLFKQTKARAPPVTLRSGSAVFAGDICQAGFQTFRITLRFFLQFFDFMFLTLFTIRKILEGNENKKCHGSSKEKFGRLNERALCLLICSVHVKQHTGLLGMKCWPNFESSLRKIGPTTFVDVKHTCRSWVKEHGKHKGHEWINHYFR